MDKNQIYLSWSLFGMSTNQALVMIIKLIDVNEIKALICLLLFESLLFSIYLIKKAIWKQ